MELDLSIGRLVVELKEKDFATLKTNEKLVAVKLYGGDLYLVIVTAWIPKTNLREMGEIIGAIVTVCSGMGG